MKKLHNELKQMSLEQLELKLEELRRELFKLRLNAATSHVKSFSSTKTTLRRAIACALTRIREHKSSEQTSEQTRNISHG
jgi:ribosomal protein L29